MIAVRHWSVVVAALAFAVAGAGAQAKGKDAGKACNLDHSDPSELNDAYNQLNKALLLNQPDQKKKALSNAVEKLSLRADHYAKNKLAYDFLLGQALVEWSAIPGIPDPAKRGQIGFLGDKDQSIDLLKTADSLFSVVEKEAPGCTDETQAYRENGWRPLINAVGPLLNAKNIDSASKVLTRADIIYNESPYNAYFAGQIAYNRDSNAAASVAYERVVTLGKVAMATDSNVSNIMEYASFMAPYTGQRAADVMTAGPDQTAAYKRVATLYQAYLKTYNCAQFAENAQSGLIDALHAVNDTAGMRAELTAMSTAAKPCSDMTWYNAARDAKEMGANDLAVKLADKAVAYSPWSAGLGNAAQVYYEAKAWDQLLPVARRLVVIAPNMPDDYQLAAQALFGIANKPGTAAAAQKAYKDSAVAVYELGEALDVNVRVSEFTSNGMRRTIGGTLQLVDHSLKETAPAPKPKPGQKGAKPAPPPPPAPAAKKPEPRPVTIKVEFLDITGATIATDSQTVTATMDATQFRISVDNPKIVGYKYAPIK